MPGLLWAIRFGADGRPTYPAAGEELRERGQSGFLWLHLNLVDARVAAFAEASKLCPGRLVDAAFANDPHQRILLEDGHAGGVVADLRRGADSKAPPEIGGRLHFVLGPDLLVTGRHHPIAGPDLARDAVAAGESVLAPIDLLELLVAPVIAAMAAASGTLSDTLDAIEDRILEQRIGDDRRRLGFARRDAVRLHRQLVGLRAVFHRLEQDGAAQGLAGPVIGSAAQLAQRLDSLDRDILTIVERARLMQDELAAQVAERTNQQLHTLSVLTALFLPPTLVAGLFSINPLGLPAAEHMPVSSVALAVAVLSALAAFLVLRRLGINARRR